MNAPINAPLIHARHPAAIRTADGLALAYEDWGAGRPVVLVHSWGIASPMWRQQVPALVEAGFRVVVFDRRGHGRSGGNGRGYDIDTLADDLAAVLDQLDLTDAVLVGHSMAGAEIARYLTRHGSRRVARAVLLAPATPFMVRTPDNPLGLETEMIAQSRAAMRADFTGWVAANADPFFAADTPESTKRWLIELLLATPFSVALATLLAYFDTDFRDDMRAIDMPVLIVHGDADASAPVEITGRPTAELIPDCRLQVLEGAAHGLFLTHAEAVNRAVIDFASA
ncbi:MAG: alpha/beta hydrolase [Proteobacteria bacterium]|nr:alpha/beta hydrolase [Pseudomonadota bacterium]